MEVARRAFKKFAAERNTRRIPDDLPALNSSPRTSEQVPDHYLADLASKHGLMLATFDGQLKHPAAELISTAPV